MGDEIFNRADGERRIAMSFSVDILTIFPGMFPAVLGESIVGRAQSSGLVEIDYTDIRSFAQDRHLSVDDRPYGGGPGMVFKPEPVFAAVDHVLAQERAPAGNTRKLILSPQGRRLEQEHLRDLATASWVVLLCGHYEGFDERIHVGLSEAGFEEVSIGDYVLSGGEIPAMVILEGVVRLLPGAIGDPESANRESFEEGLLDYPQYTRPPEFRGMKVPEVLLSGNHPEIARWRQEQALQRTRQRRSDLLGDGTAVDGAGLISAGNDSKSVC